MSLGGRGGKLPGGYRKRALRADHVRPGYTLWNDATMSPLEVVAVRREELRADGNLAPIPGRVSAGSHHPGTNVVRGAFDAPEGEPATTSAVVFTVRCPLSGKLQDLGGYAPFALIQVVGYEGRPAPVPALN